MLSLPGATDIDASRGVPTVRLALTRTLFRMTQDSVPDLLRQGRPSFSFEFFPPGHDEAEQVLWSTIRRLEPFAPSFVSVTYGAGGTTRDRTVRTTGGIASATTLTVMAHLTCVGASRSELRGVVGQYVDAGVRNILALRGDPPGGLDQEWTPHPGGLNHAVELVEMLQELGDFAIGVACSPHKHPESPSLEHDAKVLADKARAGADFAITQLFFEVDEYSRLVERAAAAGCDIPIIPGLMPLTNYGQLERFALMSGVPVPAWLRERIESVKDDKAAVRAVGVEAATKLAQDLLDRGAPGIHTYTLNRSTASLEIFQQLGLTPGR